MVCLRAAGQPPPPYPHHHHLVLLSLFISDVLPVLFPLISHGETLTTPGWDAVETMRRLFA